MRPILTNNLVDIGCVRFGYISLLEPTTRNKARLSAAWFIYHFVEDDDDVIVDLSMWMETLSSSHLGYIKSRAPVICINCLPVLTRS